MTTFNGFQSPNFTQVPNEYLEYTTSAQCDLTALQMRIMNLVFRETFGWHDKHKALVISSTYIMDLFDIKKRNSVVNALTDLVDNKQFLESIEVGKLSKKARSSIEKLMKKTLHPSQKIYRLNLVNEKKRSWDNAEKPHIINSNQKVSIEDDTNQKVIDKYNQKVSINSNQKVSIVEVETIEPVSVEPVLNKGLNKLVNKISSSSSDSRNSIDNELKEKYPNAPLEQVKEELLNDETATINTDKQYKSMLEYRLKNWKPKKQNAPKQSKGKKPIRTELIPEHMQDGYVEPVKPKEEIDAKKQEIDDMLKQLRGVN